MIVFIGEFEVTLDAKGRFLLPAGAKKHLPEGHGGEFIIARGQDTCLNLYPKENWNGIVEDLRKVNQFNKDAAAYLRYSLMGATGTELDSAGRLLIPPNLREHAGLEKEVMLISILDKIEIWDKSKYQQFFDSFTQEKYDELQQRVMGGPGARNEK